jgi:flagellar basal body rod protein FlgG
MIRGSYTSVSGIVAAQQRMDMLSNNIANVNTTGFKEILETQQNVGFDVGITWSDGSGWAGLGSLSLGTTATGMTVNRLQGPLMDTGVPTDLGIAGDGLFVVGTATGPAYTRAGNFLTDAAGTLVNQQGLPVLDTTGRAIAVPAGAGSFSVAADGTVNGTGQRIALVQFPATGLTRRGENLYAIAGPVTPVAAGEGSIHQGVLEGSNVNLASSMTELIAIQRSFQLASRSLVIQDGTLADANSIGRLR